MSAPARVSSTDSRPALPALACRSAFTLLRSLADGAWASRDELSRATGLSTSTVAAALADLETSGFVERSEDRYRIDCQAVRQALAAAAEVA